MRAVERRRGMNSGGGLPYDAEIEYIQTDGAAYINTGIKPSSNTTFEIDIYIPNHGSTGFWAFGSRVSGNSGQLAYLNDGSRNEKSWRFGSAAPVVTPKLSEGWHYFDNTETPRILKIDTSISITASANTFSQTNYPIYLLCLNVNGTASASAVGARLGNVKIYESGVLVFDGIPVRKDGVGYIYDSVSKSLFGNAGSGAFALGLDVYSNLYGRLLPSLTIISGQTPAIITDYYPNEKSKFVFSCKISERPSTAANKCMYGTFTYINNTLYRRADFQFRNNYHIQAKYSDGAGGLVEVSSYSLNTKYYFEVWNNTIKMDGSTYNDVVQSAFTADYPLVLFSNCNNGTPSIVSTPAGGFVGSLYGTFDIYEDGVLMRSYHPVKKDGRVGLWEIVTSQLYFSQYGEFSE